MKKLLFFLLCFSFSAGVYAQSDASGCSDHPLFTRMKGFYIAECKTEFGEEEFMGAGYKLIGGNGKITKVEGNKTRIVYKLGDGQSKPSSLQIRRNFGNAIKAIGGKVIMETNEWDFGNADLINMQHSRDGRTIWASVSIHHFADGQEYVLTVVEPEAMKQDVAGNDLLKELNEKGFVTFHINFATNSSTLGADAGDVVDQIVGLLQADPTLKLSIEGHTDNTGTAANNLTLSTNRAKAVMKAVERKMTVTPGRLKFKGWGQTKPVADNATAEGKAQNRRVEIVKQ
ncbi:MAG TPA: OmpA family protein [Flavisolibacter sp.]|nr:OmpA family protein [Flavisolibacter sp.]